MECRIPHYDIWLQYTLQNEIPNDKLHALTRGARQAVKSKIDQGLGRDEITPYAHYGYSKGGYRLDANEYSPPLLTWNLLLMAIDLVQKCAVGWGVPREIEGRVYDNDGVWFANIDVKRDRRG